MTEYLHDRVGCRALFATHYHELARLADRLPGLRNYCVLVQEAAGEIVFLHQVVPGSAAKSYGIHAARLGGVPQEVLGRAEQVLGELEARPLDGSVAVRRGQPSPVLQGAPLDQVREAAA